MAATGDVQAANFLNGVPTLDDRLTVIQKLSLDEANCLLKVLDGNTARVPWDFIADCSLINRLVSLRACLLCYAVTSGKQLPQALQLRSVLAIANDQDCLVNTRTGKTLPIALNILLQDRACDGRTVTITVSPLKRLQITRKNDFNTKYHCPTVTINEETPKNQKWYDECVYNVSTNTPGYASHLLVTAEQLCTTAQGREPPLFRILQSDKFMKRIRAVNIDEVHTVYTSGISRYEQPPFRPAWGLLGYLRCLLPTSVPFRCLSATMTPYMVKTIRSSILRPKYISIRFTANRADTTYATHQVPTKIEDPRNYECFIRRPITVTDQPRVLIFFDSAMLATLVAEYLLSQFPDTPEFQSPPIVRHYHSLMSTAYLEQTHADFTDDNGSCKILCAASGDSVGIDFSNVEFVCNAGLPRDQSDIIQWAGRVGRRPGMMGLLVIFYDAWVSGISLEGYQGDTQDLDRPQLIPEKQKMKSYLTARQRASYASVKYIQSKDCLRKELAEYLDEDLNNAAVLSYDTEYCCDRHPNKDGNMFDLNAALPSPLYVPNREPVPAALTSQTSQERNRPVIDQQTLTTKLENWVENNKGDCARHHVLDKVDCSTLCKQPSGVICTSRDVVKILEETEEWEEEWGTGIAKVIFEHDKETLPSDQTK